MTLPKTYCHKLAAAAVSILAAGLACAAPPTITNLGVLPGGLFSEGNAISSDGSVVVGSSGTSNGGRAFRWTSSGGMENLGTWPNSNAPSSNGKTVSSDGSIVAGDAITLTSNRRAFLLVGGVMQDLGIVPGAGANSTCFGNGMSGDGMVVVGDCSIPGGAYHPFRWTSEAGMQDMGPLPGGVSASANAANSDGSAVVGRSYINSFAHSRAFLWIINVGKEDLGVPPGASDSYGIAISADGLMVAGYSWSTSANERPFRWVRGLGMQDLGVLPGTTNSRSAAISADGSIVTGYCDMPSGSRAFLWNDRMGIVDLQAYLSRLGADLTGWTLTNARGISADGSAMTGVGMFNGLQRAWLVTGISYCGTADFDGDSFPGTDADIEAFFACLGGDCCPNCWPLGADFNADGDVGTDADIDSFFRVLGGGPC